MFFNMERRYLPDHCQVIIGTNDGVLLIETLWTNLIGIEYKCNNFHTRKGIWKYRLQNGYHFASTSVYWNNIATFSKYVELMANL